MKSRAKPINVLILIMISTASTLLVEEGIIRVDVLRKSDVGECTFRKASRYADYLSDDDFWKLEYKFGSKHKPPQNPHPLLGWVGNFDRDNYKHNDSRSIDDRIPVLLYGDSFAACATKTCFQDLLNQDIGFSDRCYLLNYSVGGYGVDQIQLLYKHSINLYSNPIVIISFMTLDLDRSILSVRIGQKPYYTIENNLLVLKGVPINPNPVDYFEENPPRIKSYLWRLLIHSNAIPERLRYILNDEERRIRKKKRINRMIIEKIVEDLGERNLPHFFVIFHPHWPKMGTPLDGPDTWRDVFVRELLENKEIPYIWSKDIILGDAKATGKRISEYFIPANGHPTDYCNRLIANEIKKRILKDILKEDNGVSGQS